ncbi:MAG TPA: radical SAM protein [Terriglobia bacterium]|nr:radical SAM protein [Terriglobia bacterium]
MASLTTTGPVSLGSTLPRAEIPQCPLNPCELEIDLFCKGIRVDPSCDLSHDARLITRTRAGLGSGLEIVIPGPLKDIWVNVPVEESFAHESCYRLIRKGPAYWLIDDHQRIRYEVRIPPEPEWYQHFTSLGTPMHKVGVLQGTYLGIYLSNTCGFWYHSPSLNCKFCTTGLNVGVNEAAEKQLEDVVEVARAAKDESSITFVHFNSGYHTDRDLDIAAPFVKAVKSRVGALVGVQVIPTLDFSKYDRLRDLGADHFSFCYEFHNPEYFRKLCPGKAKLVGQKTFFRALEYTSKKMGKGACSGEIIAGVEPLEDTVRAIDYITGVGAFPTVCIFRPTKGSDMEGWPPPRYEEMRTVFAHVYEACRRNNIPIDVTPGIEVSLVVQPGDTRYLAPGGWPSAWYDLKMKVMKGMAQPYFWWKMQPKDIDASELLTPQK